MNTQSVYQDVLAFTHDLLADYPGVCSSELLTYLALRAQDEHAIDQDLMPLFVYVACGGESLERAIPLTTAWTFVLAAAHWFDSLQDRGKATAANAGIGALGAIQFALSRLPAEAETIGEINHAIGQLLVLGANAQQDEAEHGSTWTRREYLTTLIGKAAIIIAVGVWMGGRLAGQDDDTLQALSEFGTALGMVRQLSDDLMDLEEDLARGIYTLPVLECLAQTAHPSSVTLRQLLGASHLDYVRIRAILEEMGGVAATQRLIRAYQLQVAALFNVIPGLRAHFAHHVAAAS